MHRSKRIVVMAHCLLNANAKVFPLAACPGVHAEAVVPFIEDGAGIVQLPCPETYHLGMARFGMTREQYDTLSFRRACEELLDPVVVQLVAFRDAGYEIGGVVGMDGSPSCGVHTTCEGFCGGEVSAPESDIPAQIAALRMVPGQGVFIEIFRAMLAEHGITPPFMAVDEANPGAILPDNQ